MLYRFSGEISPRKFLFALKHKKECNFHGMKTIVFHSAIQVQQSYKIFPEMRAGEKKI